jgi:5-methylcytosine-specific restriction enzyme A
MPNRICPCGFRVPRGVKCPCKARKAKVQDTARGNASQRGYNAEWQLESKAFLTLSGNALCACGCGRAADMVDHIIGPKGDMRLFWDRNNWQPFNGLCNRRKAIKCEGGFGKLPAA